MARLALQSRADNASTRNGVDRPAIGRKLIEELSDARRKSDALFDLVRSESLFERPIPERHRLVFYIGHLEAFDWNLLHERAFGLASFAPELDRLFAFGIDPVERGLPTDQPSDWPALDGIRHYVRDVRARLDGGLSANLDLGAPARDGVPLETLLNVAIEHRLMHLETLAYMLHQLPPSRKIRPSNPPIQAPSQIPPQAARSQAPSQALSPAPSSMVQIPAGSVTLGLSRDSGVFGWDNERERHAAHIPAFAIDRTMVTNGQFLEFLQAGGYGTRAFWSPDDWDWKQADGIAHPVFWKRVGDAWLYRTMFEETDLPLDWPVYVSLAEAKAYAHWAGKTLPTEEQWHRVAYGTPGDGQRRYPWGDEAPDPSRGNFDSHRWDPAPVNAYPKGRSAFEVAGLLGNGWEWTATVFAPFTGFKPSSFYPGYSADFFDGRHFVMKGGSARTAARLLRPTFRNWFQAHYQYAYAGFRCASTD